MRLLEIFGISLLALFLLVMSSGCINNTSVKEEIVTPTVPPQAVEFHKSGFSAYIDGKYETALDFYNKSLNVDPKYARAWMDKGNVLIKLNRTTEAIAAYDAALALDNNIPQVWNSRGEALMTLGRYNESLESFDQVLKMYPDNVKAKENRELALGKLK
jgi:tetratricopeptide (TPR) repeat protein